MAVTISQNADFWYQLCQIVPPLTYSTLFECSKLEQSPGLSGKPRADMAKAMTMKK
jgi:hypothetical protein